MASIKTSVVLDGIAGESGRVPAMQVGVGVAAVEGVGAGVGIVRVAQGSITTIFSDV